MEFLASGLQWLLGLLATALVGTWVAFIWQKRGWLFQQRLKRASDKYESQIGLIRDLFLLVDKRVYASRVYLDVLISGSPDEIIEERKSYRAVVQEWNEKAFGLATFVRIRFSSQLAYKFDGYFPSAFEEIDRKLGAKRKGSRIYTQAELTLLVRSDLDRLNAKAREFMNSMYMDTTETLGVIDEDPEVSYSNISNLGCLYLIKHLFELRSDPQ